MNGLRGDVDEYVQDYLAQPSNFGADSSDVRSAEADAIRAAVKWTLDNADWRVLAGFIPGRCGSPTCASVTSWWRRA